MGSLWPARASPRSLAGRWRARPRGEGARVASHRSCRDSQAAPRRAPSSFIRITDLMEGTFTRVAVVG